MFTAEREFIQLEICLLFFQQAQLCVTVQSNSIFPNLLSYAF